MTNLEWIKNDDEKLKRSILCHWGVNKNTQSIFLCGNVKDYSLVTCRNCLLYDSNKTCPRSREEWLNKEHEPLYKEGDIVVSDTGFIYIVIEKKENKNTIILADNINDFYHSIGIIKTEDAIKEKIGNIYDNKEE